MTIKKRLILLISLLIIFNSLILGIIAIIIATRIVEQNTNAWLVSSAELGAELVHNSIQSKLEILQKVANLETVRGMEAIPQFLTLFPYIEDLKVDDLAVIDTSGHTFHINSIGEVNLSHRDYVQKALNGQTAISDVIPVSDGMVKVEFPVINYVVPIFGEDEVVIGALLARTNALDMVDIIKNIRAQGNTYTYISNKDGLIIAHTTRPEMIMQNPLELAKTDPSIKTLAEMTQQMLVAESGHSSYLFNGKTMLCGFAHIPNFNLFLTITAEQNFLMADVVFLRNIIIIVMAVFVLVGFLAALYIANFIGRRLGTVRRAVDRFGAGNFSEKVKILFPDEIGAIGSSLNQCVDNIQRLVSTIKAKAFSISETGEKLSDSMTKTTNVMNRVNKHVLNIDERMINQSSSINETTATMRQMIITINKLSDNVETQSASVTQSSSAIEEMLANIKSVTQTLIKNAENVKFLTKASDAGRSGLQEVAQDIQGIARESEGLLEINAVMENIAGQTNLLSMNAAIEAAHAGDAGKGFAVVADEIRKLAESSKEQSKIISEVLNKIKESIDKIMQSTSMVLNKFEVIDKGVKTVSEQEDNVLASMEEQNTGSKQILESVTRLNDLTRQVKNGSIEMREGSKQVLDESQNLEHVTTEITGAIKEMESEINQISKAVEQVNETTIQNKENISVLESEMGRFKIE